jgi:hypothetical protein
MATRVAARTSLTDAGGETLVRALYAIGAIALAGEAVVHVQQYVALYHEVRWIGPLFLANAAACVVAIAGLAYRPTRELAAVAGVIVSAVALGSLLLSYAHGLFGWQEAGLPTAVELVLIFEVSAVIMLSAALAAGVLDERAGH